MLYVFSKTVIADHKFSCVMVAIPDNISNKIIKWSKKNVPDNELHIDHEDESTGRETEIHVTVKYGLHTDTPAAVKDLISNFGSFDIELGKISQFESEDHDVLKIDVKSDKLHKLNKLISDNLTCTDTHPTYKPHITVAYVKKGKGKKHIGNIEFQGSVVTATKVQFSSSSGDKSTISLV